MKTSASQLETLDLCARKWWLKYQKRMPEIQKGYQEFGTALHACCERFLLGEEPFPEGWHKDLEPADAALIQVLVNKGIDAGYLEARPGSEVEVEGSLQVEDLELVYFIDHRTPDRIEDHKSSKSVRYLKGPKALLDNIQMNVYGKALLEKARIEGRVPPEIITYAHNQFIKDADAPIVKRAAAETTPAQIESFWEGVIRPLVRKQKETALVENPFDIPEPPPKACRAFGGCPYVTICSGTEDLLTYKRRIDSIIRNKQEKPTMSEIQPVKPSDFLSSRMGKAPAAAAPSINPPPPPAAPAVEKPAAPPSDGQAPPPWFNPECPMCKKKKPGFNLQLKKPCRICLSITKVDPEAFEWAVEDDGRVSWWVKGEKVAEVAAPAEVEDAGSKTAFSADDLYEQLKECKTVEAVGELCEKAEGVLEETDLETFMAAGAKRIEALTEHPVAKKKAAKPKEEKPARPPADKETRTEVAPNVTAEQVASEEMKAAVPEGIGPMLLVGCAAVKGIPNQLMVRAEEFLAKHFPDYWKAENVFDARKEVRNRIAQIVKGYDGWVIVQTGRDPDVDNLMSSLIPYAAVVFRGTVQ